MRYINSVQYDETAYIDGSIDTQCFPTDLYSTDESCTFVVPEDEYFLLGDNRASSYDSRVLGTYKISELYGRVVFKIG